ncbi:MAG: cell division protein ZapA [Nitrospiraceae bacterium]|jgi:cell division protein ZapA|nr:cell division protein ZapA [Nitrospirota bacterium]MDA8340059.1 cell division protein ZapA [Nitrospiraceae bacterium]
MGSIEVHILGQKYVIKGDAAPEYIQQIADFVDGKLQEVYATSPDITPLKAAILAALNIADELHRLKNEYNTISQSIKHIENKADSIIKLFD